MTLPAIRGGGRRLVAVSVAIAIAGTSLGGCTVGLGAAGKSGLADLVGINGLLADPAAVVHRPSASDTIDRLWAGRILGIAPRTRPDAEMLGTLMDHETATERQELRLRWALYVGDSQGSAKAIAETARICRGTTSKVAAGSAHDDCERVITAMWSFLRVTPSATLPDFEHTFSTVRGPGCPASTRSLDEQFLTVLCGGSVTDAGAFDGALAMAFPEGQPIDSRALWTAAAVGLRSGFSSDRLRELVSDALGKSQVKGIYFDEIPAQGTLITTWALLHLAADDRGGLDTQQLVAAVKREPTDEAPDRALLARASLALLGERDRPSARGPIALEDPDGPYNPFIALAARDAGDLGSVSLGFTTAQARASPERLASFVLTNAIVNGTPTRLAPSDAAVLRRLAAPTVEAEAHAGRDVGASSASSTARSRSRLLGAVALVAAGLPSRLPEVPAGCRGAAWLVDAGGGCDIRASLLVALWHDFTSTSGAG